ncbi:MAG: amidophosphoribosyltransferase [Alphaproteobacteria bacterium]|nr:amidophosphoribosyltransferase [Alphaproteobacteria bacterium]
MTVELSHSTTPDHSYAISPDDDHFHDECAVFAIFGSSDAAAHTALGLHALQHRGQEATGIVSFDGEQYHSHRGQGRVAENFQNESVMAALKGYSAVGHNRYSTTGETSLRNVQPLFAEFVFGGMALAHNGNLTNYAMLRRRLQERGSLFQSSSDTEIVIHLMATSLKATMIERLEDALHHVEGAYAFVALVNNAVIGVRDPLGLRPLVLGRLGDAWVLASETCAFDIIGAEFVREIEPGEVVVIDGLGVHSRRPFATAAHRACIFEHVYFSRPDSMQGGVSFYQRRKHIGMELARESHVEADVVIPVPDSGVPAALGYAAEAKIDFELGIIRNHYVGRTFIEPSDHIRHLGVRLKHNANPMVIRGKRVILVDDSIVRGTTSTKIVEMVRNAGATEVHLRIASPPTTHSCYYGVDTPLREQLLAYQHDQEGMAKFIGCDSLAFVSIDGLYRAMGPSDPSLPGIVNRDPMNLGFCDACFTGEYPTRITSAPHDSHPEAVIEKLEQHRNRSIRRA